jgi:hypothetical protein
MYHMVIPYLLLVALLRLQSSVLAASQPQKLILVLSTFMTLFDLEKVHSLVLQNNHFVSPFHVLLSLSPQHLTSTPFLQFVIQTRLRLDPRFA